MVRETRHLWVGNLPDNIREERILEHFKRYGKVQSVKILPKKDEEACNGGVGANSVSGNSGVCATVAFIDIKSAAKAHNADNKIEERTLKTDYYEPPVNSTATSAIFIHERDDSLGRVAGPPYSSNRQNRYPIGLQDDRNYDRSGYYYERAAPGERDTYVRRSLGLGGYHDDEAYPVSRGRSRDRYIRSATAGTGGTSSSYQDANERNQNHFGSHRNRQHFDQQQRYPGSSGGSDQYSASAAGEERENSGTRNGSTTVTTATASRRPSLTVPTVTSTVTSPPHNNANNPNTTSGANVSTSNGGSASTRRTKKPSASRSRSRSRSNSHSRSRSSSRSSNGSGSSSVSSKLRSSSSNSCSSRSRSPSKSRSPAASHCSQSSGKSGRVGDRPASAITGPSASSAVPFIQSAVTTPAGTMVSSSSGGSGNVMVASQVTLPPNSGIATLASSLSESNCCDKDDKRPLGICVRNLPVRSTDTSLKDGLFHEYKKHGKVTMVKVIGQGIDRYAVVCFKKPEDVEKALEVSKDKLFFGCKIEVTAHEGLDGEDNEFRPLEADLDEFHPKATRTLFIGNLEKDITTTELRKHFDQFGEIIFLKMSPFQEIDIKKQGSSSSYAFIQYSDIGSVVKAMRKLDGENLGSNRIKLGFGKSMPTNCVWLDGVTDGILEKFLARHFNRFGPVNYTAIDRERGHALVFYDTTEFAQIAVSEMRGRVLGGKRLQVDYASRECQQVFFEKLELSGQMIPSGADRPWERTRERRDFDVIREERPIQEPEIAKPKPQAREARVGFENRTYPRYENPPRPNSRGSFRGTVHKGTFNARGRGTQSFPTRYELYHDEFVERRISRNYDEEFSQGSGASFEDSYEQELREYGYSQRERRDYGSGEERNVRGRSFSPLRRRDSTSVSPNSRERHKDDRSVSPSLREVRSNSLRVGDKHDDHYIGKERYLRSDDLEDLEDGKDRLKMDTIERLSRKRNKHSALSLTVENEDLHSQSPTRSRHQSRSQSPSFLCKDRKNSKELHDRSHGCHAKSPNNSQGSSRVSSPSRDNDIADVLMDYNDHKEQKRKVCVDGKFDLRDSITQGSSHPSLKSSNAISFGDNSVLHGRTDSDSVKRKSTERQEALDARHPDSLVSFSGLSERKKRLLAMSGTPLIRSDYHESGHGKNKMVPVSECLSARSSIDSKSECEVNEDKHLRLIDSRKKHGHIFHLLDHLAERGSGGVKCSNVLESSLDNEKPSQKKAKILVRDLSPPSEASTKELAVINSKDSKELPLQRHSIPIIELDHSSDYAIPSVKHSIRKTVSDPRNKSSDLHHSHFTSQRLKKLSDLEDASGVELHQDHHDGLLTSSWRKSSLQHPSLRRDDSEHDKLLLPPFGVQLANEVTSTSDSIPHIRHGKSRSLLESLHDSKKERDSSPLSLPLPKFAATLRTPKASPNPLSSPTPSSVSPNGNTSPKNTFTPSKLTLGTPTVEEKLSEKAVDLPVPMDEVGAVEMESKINPLTITTETKDNEPVVSEISSPLLSPVDKTVTVIREIEESCSSSEEPIDTSPNRPSIEERIKALDEKYNAWSGSTRSFSSSLSGDSPTTPTCTIDYQKYKRRPRYSFLTTDSRPEPSEIMKSLLAKSTIFDQDSKRLQHINEKYEPKEVKIETSVKTRPSFRTKAEAKEFSLPIQLNTTSYVNSIVMTTGQTNTVGFINAPTAVLPSSQCSPVALSHSVLPPPQPVKNVMDSVSPLKPVATPEKLLLSALPITKPIESKPTVCLKENKSIPPQSISSKLTVEVNDSAADLPAQINSTPLTNVTVKKEILSPVKTETISLSDPRKEAKERLNHSTSVSCSLPIKETLVKKESPERESKKEVAHQSSKEISRKDRELVKENSYRKDSSRSHIKKEEQHCSSIKENPLHSGNPHTIQKDTFPESSIKDVKESKREVLNNIDSVNNHSSSALKRRLPSLDSSESDSGKSIEQQSFHDRETWHRKDSHSSEVKSYEPESKKSKLVNSVKETDKLRETSLSPPPLIKKPVESKKERSNSGKSEKSSKSSSKCESISNHEKDESGKTSEQKNKMKHESSRSKDEKRNKSKEGRGERSEHSSRSEKSSSKSSKYNTENKSTEKDSRSSHSSNNGKSSSSKKESIHGSERERHKGEKKSSSSGGDKAKQESTSSSSKSKNNKKRSSKKSNFWEEEPVYFSMYDKVKARSSKSQTIKDQQKDLESVRQKFNQLKQSRAKREEKSKSIDSDRDSDMMMSPPSSESDGNKSKSSPPTNKTKQLKKKKLVIESSSDDENRQPPMDLFFDDTSSKIGKEHSSNSNSDSDLDFSKINVSSTKPKSKKLDIYDLDSSDQEEPTPLRYAGRKKSSNRPKPSPEKISNQKPKIVRSDFESSDNEHYSNKPQVSLTPTKKKEHKKKKSARKEKLSEVKSDYDMSDDEPVIRKEPILTKKVNKLTRDTQSIKEERTELSNLPMNDSMLPQETAKSEKNSNETEIKSHKSSDSKDSSTKSKSNMKKKKKSKKTSRVKEKKLHGKSGQDENKKTDLDKRSLVDEEEDGSSERKSVSKQKSLSPPRLQNNVLSENEFKSDFSEFEYDEQRSTDKEQAGVFWPGSDMKIDFDADTSRCDSSSLMSQVKAKKVINKPVINRGSLSDNERHLSEEDYRRVPKSKNVSDRKSKFSPEHDTSSSDEGNNRVPLYEENCRIDESEQSDADSFCGLKINEQEEDKEEKKKKKKKFPKEKERKKKPKETNPEEHQKQTPPAVAEPISSPNFFDKILSPHDDESKLSEDIRLDEEIAEEARRLEEELLAASEETSTFGDSESVSKKDSKHQERRFEEEAAKETRRLEQELFMSTHHHWHLKDEDKHYRAETRSIQNLPESLPKDSKSEEDTHLIIKEAIYTGLNLETPLPIEGCQTNQIDFSLDQNDAADPFKLGKEGSPYEIDNERKMEDDLAVCALLQEMNNDIPPELPKEPEFLDSIIDQHNEEDADAVNFLLEQHSEPLGEPESVPELSPENLVDFKSHHEQNIFGAMEGSPFRTESSITPIQEHQTIPEMPVFETAPSVKLDHSPDPESELASSFIIPKENEVMAEAIQEQPTEATESAADKPEEPVAEEHLELTPPVIERPEESIETVTSSHPATLEEPINDSPEISQPENIPDLSVPELPVPELPVPELPVPELSVTELTVPELSVPELPVPELPVPEPPVQELSIPELPVSSLSSNEMDGESDIVKTECKKLKKKKRKDKGKRDSKDEFDASQLEIHKDLADSFLNLSELSTVPASIPPVLEPERLKEISNPLSLLDNQDDYRNDLHRKITKDPFRPTLFKEEIFKDQFLESLSNPKQHHFKENTFKEVTEPFHKREEIFKSNFEFPKTDSGIGIPDFSKGSDLASNPSPLADHASEETEIEQDDTKDYPNDDYYSSRRVFEQTEERKVPNEELPSDEKTNVISVKETVSIQTKSELEQAEKCVEQEFTNVEEIASAESDLMSPTTDVGETDESHGERRLTPVEVDKAPTNENVNELNTALANHEPDESKKPERPRRGRKPKNRKHSESSSLNYDGCGNEPSGPVTPQRTSSRRAKQTAPERCRRSLRSDPYALLSPPELSNHGSNDEHLPDKHEGDVQESRAPQEELSTLKSELNSEKVGFDASVELSHHEEASNDQINAENNTSKEEPKKRRGRRKKMSGDHHQNYLASPPSTEKSESKVDEIDASKDNHRTKESRLWLSISASDKTAEPKVTAIKSNSSVYDVFEFRDSEDEELTFERDIQSSNKERLSEQSRPPHVPETKHETKLHDVVPPISHTQLCQEKEKKPDDGKLRVHEEIKHKSFEDNQHKTYEDSQLKAHDENKHKENRPALTEEIRYKTPEENKHKLPEENKHNIHEESKHKVQEDCVQKIHEDNKPKTHGENKHKVHDENKHKVHDENKHKVHDENKHKTHEENKHKIHDEGKHRSQEESKHKSHEESKHKVHEEKDGGAKEYVTELSQHGKISITIRLHQRDGNDGNGASTAEVVKTSEAVSMEETKTESPRVEKNAAKTDIASPAEPHQTTNTRQTRKSSRLTAQVNKTSIDEVIEDVVKGNFKNAEGTLISTLDTTPARATRRTRASRRSEEAMARLGEDSAGDLLDSGKNKNEPIFIIPDNKVKDPHLDIAKPLLFHTPASNIVESVLADHDVPKAETKISLRYYRIARSNARLDNPTKDGQEIPNQAQFRPNSIEDPNNPPATHSETNVACPSLPVMKVELPTITTAQALRVKNKELSSEKAGEGDEDSDSRSSPTVLIDPVTGFLTPVNKKGEARPPMSISQEALKCISQIPNKQTSVESISIAVPVTSEPSSVITKNSNLIMNASPAGISPITPVASGPTIINQPLTIKLPVSNQKTSVVVEPHPSNKPTQPTVISSTSTTIPSQVNPKGITAVIKDVATLSTDSSSSATLPPPITVLSSSITTASVVVSTASSFPEMKHLVVSRSISDNQIRPSKEFVTKIMGDTFGHKPQGARVVVTGGHSLPPPLVHSQVSSAPTHSNLPVAVTSTPSVKASGKPQTSIGHPSVPIAQPVPGWPQAVSYPTTFPPHAGNTHHNKVGKLPPQAQTVVCHSGVRTLSSIPPIPTISAHSRTSETSARTSGIQHHIPSSSPSTRPETNVITSGMSSKEMFQQNMPKPPAAHSGSSISHIHPSVPVSETRPITPGEAGQGPVIQSGSGRNSSRTPPNSGNRNHPGFQNDGNSHHISHQFPSGNPNASSQMQSNHGSKHRNSNDSRAHMVPNMVKASHQQVSMHSPTFLSQAGFAGFDPVAVHANAQGTAQTGVIAELLQNPHFFQQHHKEIMAAAAVAAAGGGQFNDRGSGPLVRPSTPSSAPNHPEISRLGNPTPPHTPTPPVTTATQVIQPSELHSAHMAVASLHMRHLGQSPLLVPHPGMHPSELNAYVHQQMLYAAAANHPHYAMHSDLRAQQEAARAAAALGIATRLGGYPAMAAAATPPINFRQPAEPRLPHPSSAETKSDLKPSVEPAKVPTDRLTEVHHHHHHHHENTKSKNENDSKSLVDSKRINDSENDRLHGGSMADVKHVGPGPPPPLSNSSLRPHVPYPTPVRQLSPHLSVSPHERITDSPAVANLYAQSQIRGGPGGHHLAPDHKVDLSRQPPPSLQMASVKQHEAEQEIKPPAAHQNPPSTIPMYAFEPSSHKTMVLDRGPPPNNGVLALKKDSSTGGSQQVSQMGFQPGQNEIHHHPENIPSHSKHHGKDGYSRISSASLNLSSQHAAVLHGISGVGFPGMPSSLSVGESNQRRCAVPTPQTGSEAPVHQPSPARAILQPSGITRTQPQTPPQANQVPAQGDSFLLQRYPVMWQGLLALKNDQAAVQMHFVSGNPRIAQHSLPAMSDSGTAPVRIAQRMRLEQTQVEGVARKMQMLDEHCILLALPCGRDHMDVLQQSNNLKNGLINYLQLKQAAGIVNAAAPGSQQPAYVIHVFPSCEFSDENMTRIAPDLLHSVSDIAHLLIIITTV